MCFTSVTATNFTFLLRISVKLMSGVSKRQRWRKKWIHYLFVLSWFLLICSSIAVDCQKTISKDRPLTNATRIHYKKERLRSRQKQLALLVNAAKKLLKRYPLKHSKFSGQDERIQANEVTPIPDHFQSGLWAVKLQFGEDDASREILDMSAEIIAKRHGLENHGQIGELKGYYLFTKQGAADTWTTMASAVASTIPETRHRKSGAVEDFPMGQKQEYTDILLRTRVQWQDHQELLYRSKRVTDMGTEESIQKHPDRGIPSTASSTSRPYEPTTRFNISSPISGQSISTAHPASEDEKSRHEFFINVLHQNHESSTMTRHASDVTPNSKYRDMVGIESPGGAGSRRMGLDLVEEDIRIQNFRHNGQVSSRFQDPLYYRQWHLENPLGNDNVGDCNVTGVWEHGITGKGVVVAVVDDGVQWDHPDLIDNYCPEGSFDLNSNDDDPMPVRDDKEENKHGTRCAGEIAAASNSHCGIGIAHGAKFSGIRILDGPLTDSMEAAAFNKHFDVNDIYSCSWGPEDDGKTVDGPHPLAKAALQHGIIKGRQGYGSIYIVASGNGGHKGDNCNYDGYANSIYTITIGAVDEFGRVPTYAEECASMLACTFSSGAGAEDGNARKIVTTDWTLGKSKKRINGCTESHTGTSAATPLAAGMVALMLEARPCLSWRDIQHIIAMTAVNIHPKGDDWTYNTAGFHHSDKKGFGLLNAWRLVNAACVWRPVPWLSSLEVECHDRRKVIPSTKSRALITTTLITKQECNDKMLNTLEQITVIVDIDHPRRGDLSITLVCPSGTTSVIGRPRKNDDSIMGLWNWAFTTVKCWGEEPDGIYRLIIHDTSGQKRTLPGELRNWKLILYGSSLTKSNIEAQRQIVAAAMSGVHLQPWYKVEENQSLHTVTSNFSTNHYQIGYCPPIKEHIHESVSLLRKSTTERMLKLIAISGCFLMIWVLYYIFDLKKLGDGAEHSILTNEDIELNKCKVTVINS